MKQNLNSYFLQTIFILFFGWTAKAQIQKDLLLKTYVSHHIGSLDKFTEVINLLPTQNVKDFKKKRIGHIASLLYNYNSNNRNYQIFLDSLNRVLQIDSTACILNQMPDSAKAFTSIVVGQRHYKLEFKLIFARYDNKASWRIASIVMPSNEKSHCIKSINPMNHEIGFSEIFSSFSSKDSCSFGALFQNLLFDNSFSFKERLIVWLIDEKIGVLKPFYKLSFWYSGHYFSSLRINNFSNSNTYSGWLIDSTPNYD